MSFSIGCANLIFFPVVTKIGTKENDISDFLSRNYSESDAEKFFKKENLPFPSKVSFSDSDCNFTANW